MGEDRINEFQKKYLLKRQDFGILYPYIQEKSVTDLDWNGNQLWINDLERGRYLADETLPEVFVERFVMLLSNVSGMPFNRANPILEVETEEMRISLVHQCVARTGMTISIRKMPATCRMTRESMVAGGYCSEEVCDFLIECIREHKTMVICGFPGCGKTELLKFLTRYIEPSDRVITIEDVMEIHYQALNPEKDCIEMKVADNFTYAQAIRASVRQFPKWIILSEARSGEVRHFLDSLRTGASGLTTLHANDVRSVPRCFANMMSSDVDTDKEIFELIDVGILIKSELDLNGRRKRWIDQVGI